MLPDINKVPSLENMTAPCPNRFECHQARTLEDALNYDLNYPVALQTGRPRDLGQLRFHALTLSQKLTKSRQALIFCEDSYNFLVGFMALALRGIDAILLSAKPALQELEQLGLSGSPLLSDQSELSPEFLLDEWKAEIPSSSPQPQLKFSPEWRFSLFTSGSTGEPKLLHKSPALLEAEIRDLEQLFGKQLGNSIICGSVSQQHIYGLLFRVLWPFCTGRTFYSELLRYPEQMQSLEFEKAALISSPSFLKRIPQIMQAPTFRAFEQIFSSGGPLPETCSCELLQTLGVAPVEVFGSTETGGIAFRQRQNPETQPDWERFPSVTVLGLENRTGKLKIFSPFINQNLCDSDGTFTTEDEVQLSPDGKSFQLHGRTDRIVKIEEKRVSLLQVERALCSLEFIQDAAAVQLQKKLPSGIERHCIGAVIQLKNELDRPIKSKNDMKTQIQKELREKLEALAIPRYFRFVAQIPENAQGKRNSSSLQAFFQNSIKPIVHKQSIGRDLPQVNGHFPGMPIIPGFLQLDWVLEICEENFFLFTAPRFSQVKFLKPILPRTTQEVTVEIKPGDSHYEFLISSEHGLHSKGQVRFSSEPCA